jgi:ribosomal-protein-alanine N-acetyltransferase
MLQSPAATTVPDGAPELMFVHTQQALPRGLERETLVTFLHRNMQPYEDTEIDTLRGLDDALCGRPEAGGFVLLARTKGRLVGVLVMLRTGMKGYVPENLLLFVAVDRTLRGRGIGASLVRAAVERCDGNVKLHVEFDNPARRLYERLGFKAKYAEMRYFKHAVP